LQDGGGNGSVRRRERGKRIAQPRETLPLIRERPLPPRSPVDRARDLVGAGVERRRVRDQERYVDAAGLREERPGRGDGGLAREPLVGMRLEPGEILDEVDPGDDARRGFERDRARRRIEAGELRQLAEEREVGGRGTVAEDEPRSAEARVEDLEQAAIARL